MPKIVALDFGHLNKTTNPADRGASWKDLVEAPMAARYLLATEGRLRALGYHVFFGLGPGSYTTRTQRAHDIGAAIYVQGHFNAGLGGKAGDYGLTVHDYRSAAGKALGASVALALGKAAPWDCKTLPGKPDDDGQARDEDLSEAYGCISACYLLKPVGLLIEPGFLDGALGVDWIPGNLDAIGVAIADGIHEWASR